MNQHEFHIVSSCPIWCCRKFQSKILHRGMVHSILHFFQAVSPWWILDIYSTEHPTDHSYFHQSNFHANQKIFIFEETNKPLASIPNSGTCHVSDRSGIGKRKIEIFHSIAFPFSCLPCSHEFVSREASACDRRGGSKFCQNNNLFERTFLTFTLKGEVSLCCLIGYKQIIKNRTLVFCMVELLWIRHQSYKTSMILICYYLKFPNSSFWNRSFLAFVYLCSFQLKIFVIQTLICNSFIYECNPLKL